MKNLLIALASVGTLTLVGCGNGGGGSSNNTPADTTYNFNGTYSLSPIATGNCSIDKNSSSVINCNVGTANSANELLTESFKISFTIPSGSTQAYIQMPVQANQYGLETVPLQCSQNASIAGQEYTCTFNIQGKTTTPITEENSYNILIVNGDTNATQTVATVNLLPQN